MAAITVRDLTKRYGSITAVDGLDFTVEPGRFTAFLGPNGAGKTTTLRSVLGLVTPDGGSATFGGIRYRDLVDPARHVGAMFEARSFHPGRSGRDHLLSLAMAAGIGERRVDEVLDLTGLGGAGSRRVRGYSTGMRQRLALCAAMLGDPGVLILDEPTNGLDPEGVRWLRTFLRGLVAEGRTVLVSSHLLAEVSLAADDVVIIASGRLVAEGPLRDLVRRAAASDGGVEIRTPDPDGARVALQGEGLMVADGDEGRLVVSGAAPDDIGRAIARAGLTVYEMRPIDRSLEEIFLELTAGTMRRET
jgi:ABC-2 type transport system ATP-binding protein